MKKNIKINENNLKDIVRNVLREFIDPEDGFYMPDDGEYEDIERQMALDNERYEEDMKDSYDEEPRFIGFNETNKPAMKINESELRSLVDMAVKGVLKEAYGYVPNDGNSMVGGRWGSFEEKGWADIAQKYIDKMWDLSEESEETESILSEKVLNAIEAYVYENEDKFRIEGTFTVSYDESTGYGSRYNPVYEIKGFKEGQIKDIENLLKKMPGANEQLISLMLKGFDDLIRNLDEGDFEMYGR